MTDRELLELAAKAADLAGMDGVYPLPTPDGQWRPWDPLGDDGDALRLAVKLRMDVETSLVHCGAICADVWDDGIEEYRSTQEPEGADPLAATRRAIVLAAAALAK